MKSRTAKSIASSPVRDQVDVTSEDSFPASDPPSWTPTMGPGGPCRDEHRTEEDAQTARGEENGRGTATDKPASRIPGIRSLEREGSMVEEVLRMAREFRPAVVVIGTRGRTAFGELFDPARAVRRKAECPVLTVHLPTRM